VSLEAHRRAGAKPLAFAILTISDTRDAATDKGGPFLAEACLSAGHIVARRSLVKDEPAEILAAVEELVADESVDFVLCTGGTGLAPRDSTPEALRARFDKEIPGFGELFRLLSYQEIGPAAILSRATAGVVRGKVVALLPGSPKALRLAWEKILAPECGHLATQARGS
jgi:molybdenum cofactor biosynthesis protein B